MSIDREELAWAAGFFDGEGCVTTRYPKTGGTGRTIALTVGQRDLRPLLRFQQAVGLGKLYGPYPDRTSPVTNLRLSGLERVQAVIALLWTWLSEPKREQARGALAKFHAQPTRRYTRVSV